MRAALRLRWIETRRRGGPWFAALAAAAVLLVSLFGGETVAGRYGAATDLAATLSYVAAVFAGAFPLAIDRERRRSYLPGASPVAPWAWALGNALAAAGAIFLLALSLYAAAAVGAAARGGVETHRVTSTGRSGSAPLPWNITVPEETTAIRFKPRTYLLDGRSAAEARVRVDGEELAVHHDRPVTVPVRGNPVRLENRSPEYAVAVDLASFRALYEEKPFLSNSLLAAVPPALGAGALAAIGVAAGAHLGAPVAALLLALLLLLSSMRGFLLDMIEHEGTLRRARETTALHHGHAHAADPAPPGRAFAKGAVKALLDLVPPIGPLDRTGEVATGEWVGDARVAPGTAMLLGALALAAAFGGIGVHLRRTP